MISVITTTYNTPNSVLARTWASLKAQTFTDWEWVIWDDSEGFETWSQIYGFASDERYKIKLHKSHVHSGSIGAVKRKAFMVAEGDILVELDHDDELMPEALQKIHDAFTNNPNVGFVYSNWCELLSDGQSGIYPEGWAFGYGSEYYDEDNRVWVMKAPPVNEVTMSHIVSAPNHVRAWRSSVYHVIGGHNSALDIADDYELVVRTYLVTDFYHIPELLYKQHIGNHTAQRKNNDRIQYLVSEISEKYGEYIKIRAKEQESI